MSYRDPRTVVYRTRGDDWSITGDLQEDGAVVDLTGATIEAQIRDVDGALVASFTATADIVPGSLILTLARADTEQIDPGVYTYDVQVTDAGDRRKTYGTGSRLVVKEDATRG